MGNRTSSHLSGFHTHLSANRLLEDDRFTWSSDADRNCIGKLDKTSGERHEYIFNSETRMTGYRKYDLCGALVTQADYFYDLLGRRMAKQVNGVVTRYVYFEEDIILEMDPVTNGIAVTYYHGPGIDEPLVAVAPREGALLPPPSYYITNGLGTVTDILGNTLSLFYSITSDSFGRIISTSGTGALGPYRYTGRELDPESGLMYYRARYYDPWAGRFVSEDPIGFAGGDINLYRYVLNAPLNFDDPFGWQPARRALQLQDFAGIAVPGVWALFEVGQMGADRITTLLEAYDYSREIRVWGQNMWSGRPGSEMRHCVVSCVVGSEFGSTVGRLGGVANEAQGFLLHDLPNLPSRLRGGSPWALQWGDLVANERGFRCARKMGCTGSPRGTMSSCIECCGR